MRAPTTDTRGLLFFANRAATDIERSRRRILPPLVKRIRTALRRVRAMCEVLLLVDDAPVTNALRKDARALMRALGPLRDLHVLRALLSDLVARPLPPAFAREMAREIDRRRDETRRALLTFDLAGFLTRARQVAQRVARLGDDHPAVLHIAWEQLLNCVPLVDEARMRAHEEVPLHALRIGLKRFRYVVESFLPTTHALVGKCLKERQDLLGEIHDLDVARTRLKERDIALLPTLRRRALARIRSRRATREKAFLKLGSSEVLQPFFAALPTGMALVDAACARLSLLSDVHTQRPAMGERRAALARTIHDAFVHENVLPLSARDAHLVGLAARWIDVRVTAKATSHTHKTAHLFYAQAVLSPLDEYFLDAFLDIVRRANHPRPISSSRVSASRTRVFVLAAIARFACVLDDGFAGRSLREVRIEGDTLLVITSNAQGRIRPRERRAFARVTKRKLVVAQVYRG